MRWNWERTLERVSSAVRLHNSMARHRRLQPATTYKQHVVGISHDGMLACVESSRRYSEALKVRATCSRAAAWGILDQQMDDLFQNVHQCLLRLVIGQAKIVKPPRCVVHLAASSNLKAALREDSMFLTSYCAPSAEMNSWSSKGCGNLS